jgi:hypothetical protein
MQHAASSHERTLALHLNAGSKLQTDKVTVLPCFLFASQGQMEKLVTVCRYGPSMQLLLPHVGCSSLVNNRNMSNGTGMTAAGAVSK